MCKQCNIFLFIKSLKNRISGSLVILLLICQADCKKLVEIPPPALNISSASVFTNDATATAVLTGIYTNMSLNNSRWVGVDDMFLYPSLSADELTLYDINNPIYLPYYTNSLNNTNTIVDYWESIYPVIYVANAAILGLTDNSNITPAVAQQLMGEAFFIRAFCYFYLVNFYGDVPLVLGTNYTTNDDLPKTPEAQVWAQIKADLRNAQGMLSSNYLDVSLVNITTQRVRPTSWAATALLARVYLYTQNWDSAASEATTVINNSSLYSLDTLNGVFLANSSETIWSLQPVNTYPSSNTGEGAIFDLPSTGPNTSGTYPVYLSNTVVSSFEPNDQRKVDWVDSVVAGATTFYFPYKYKAGAGTAATTEYSIVLRLGEQYLIRAEAEAEQNNFMPADSDVDVIRSRAGLPDITANVQSEVLAAIQHERQVELFTEWGHRWLDLKRTNTVNTVMGSPGNVSQLKGGSWNSDWQWYPITLSELEADPNLVQNGGY